MEEDIVQCREDLKEALDTAIEDLYSAQQVLGSIINSKFNSRAISIAVTNLDTAMLWLEYERKEKF